MTFGPCLCGDPECSACGNGPTPAIYERIDVALEDHTIDDALHDSVVALVEDEVQRERARCLSLVAALVIQTGPRPSILQASHAHSFGAVRRMVDCIAERIEGGA